MRENRTPPTNPWAGPARQRGFTVIELMIVVVVTALLLAIATPNLRGLLARNQLLGQANELAAALTLARSEAVARGSQAGVCASADGSTCSGDAGDWSEFVLVYVDVDNDDTLDAGEPLLKSYRSTSDVDWTADNDISEFHFRSTGFNKVAGLSNVTLCHDNLDESTRCRRVTVQPSGIVSITTHNAST